MSPLIFGVSCSVWTKVVACSCEDSPPGTSDGKRGAGGAQLLGASDGQPKSVAVKVIKNQPAYYHQVRVIANLSSLLA